ncbi:hypothetical protein B14911_27805 [Bacillus sp. NRRL B-14911]|uniref:Uncharacterized protein n=1 Tax=Bacillus infantis NRRL B-14911 TaxID=1367477 RepID=U5LAH3_9BACI|nr:hypothetical protein N288_12515 [Bacillus infantis NRRL B-14911]EAR66886.1 hypothetical protein B14911_27805 [Bacillus sp. NRRL B-14911]
MLPPPDLRLLPAGMRYPGKRWKIEKQIASDLMQVLPTLFFGRKGG